MVRALALALSFHYIALRENEVDRFDICRYLKKDY